MVYDHRHHAGNAGDLWKHLVLAEVADHLFEAEKVRVYVESHAGYPEYRLSPGGEWEGGVGRLWPHREDLAEFPYFQILKDLNPHELERYPGSASIVLGLADRLGIKLRAELWDLSPEVEMAWIFRKKGRRLAYPHFHLGDGFSGACRLTTDIEEAALLLIDSPYIAKGDAAKVEELISRSAEAGWIVLSWQMVGLETRPNPDCKFREFALCFEEADLECGPWKGATMIISWDEDRFSGPEIDDLIEKLARIERELPRIASRKSESF